MDNNTKAVAMFDIFSIASGFLAADIAVKTSTVKLITAQTFCPGKFFILFTGQTGSVKASYEAVKEKLISDIVNDCFIPNISDQIFDALLGLNSVKLDAFGCVETMDAPSTILAADAACKASDITLIEVRTSKGLGGRGFFTLTGTVQDVKAAVNAAKEVVGENLIINDCIIPRPAKQLEEFIV